MRVYSTNLFFLCSRFKIHFFLYCPLAAKYVTVLLMVVFFFYKGGEEAKILDGSVEFTSGSFSTTASSIYTEEDC